MWECEVNEHYRIKSHESARYPQCVYPFGLAAMSPPPLRPDRPRLLRHNPQQVVDVLRHARGLHPINGPLLPTAFLQEHPAIERVPEAEFKHAMPTKHMPPIPHRRAVQEKRAVSLGVMPHGQQFIGLRVGVEARGDTGPQD